MKNLLLNFIRVKLIVFSLLFTGLSIFSFSDMQAQSVTIDLSYLSSVLWKTNVELNASLVQERSKMDVVLSLPDLQSADRSLFLAYQRLLDYILEDIQANMPVAEAIKTNYEKVLTEAPKDPDLSKMPDGILGTFIPGLVETLTQATKPLPGQ